MKTISISKRVPVFNTYRAVRVRSLFNVTATAGATFTAECALPLDEANWQIGLIVGPSGSGKSSLGKAGWGPAGLSRGLCLEPAPADHRGHRTGAAVQRRGRGAVGRGPRVGAGVAAAVRRALDG